jgi:hypothetical protein
MNVWFAKIIVSKCRASYFIIFYISSTPDCAWIRTLFRWLNVEIPTCPNLQFFVEPATPVWAAITVFSPISTLWAIWIWLSKLYSFSDNCRTHCCSINRRTRTYIYIIFNITFPIWGIFSIRSIRIWCKTKPSEPIIAPEWIVQLLPIMSLVNFLLQQTTALSSPTTLSQ